jgi:long-chain fatty acid transport protein
MLTSRTPAGRRTCVLAVAAALAVASPAPRAAGFGVDFEGARSVGMATAGSASAADSSTIFYNPAGMAFLERDEVMAGGVLFLLHDRFTNEGSTILGGALPTPGTNGFDAIPTTFIPWLYGTYRVNPELALGVGLFAPFGLKTDYGSEFVGRYQSIRTALTVIDLNPAVAYRPVPWLALGAGLTIEYAQLELVQAIDFGSACVAALAPGTCAGAFGLVPGRSDGQTKIKGYDVAYGYSLGVLAEPVPGTRLSVNYRSQIDHHFDSASQTFYVPPGARAFLVAGGAPTALTGSDVSTDLPLPARLSFGAMQSFGNGLDVMFDATLTQWGVFKTTVVTPADPTTGAAAVIDQNYQDAWRFALGANYPLNEQWAIRGGVAYDQTPIPPASIQASLPDRDRVYLSIGATYRFSKAWSVDFGYSHVHYVGSIPIDRTTNTGDTLVGHFDVGGDVVAAQVRFQL